MKRYSLTVGLLVLAFTAPSVSASDKGASPFCEKHVARDYLAPLAKVRVFPRFAASGKLTVGPGSLRIFVARQQLVPIGSGVFGASGAVLTEKPISGPLNWQIHSQLERIREAKPAIVVRRKDQYVAKIKGFNGRRFGFESKGVRPGLYRLTIEIENRSGKVLEKRQEKFRAVRARSDLKLLKSFTSLFPGGQGYLKIANYGTVEASYGANYRLWNAAGEEIPVNPIFGNVRVRLNPGEAGQCFTFRVPQELPPGEYLVGSKVTDRLRGGELLTAPIRLDSP